MTVFVPALPDQRTFGGHVPPLLDLVGRELSNEVDAAVVQAVSQRPGAVALWRAWRLTPGQEPARTYVLETADPLIMSGLGDIPIEVYAQGTEPQQPTRSARNAGALLWMTAEAPALHVARVFDVVDATGARFDPGHEQLSDDLEEVACYLEAGAPVLATGARLTDVVEPARGEVVPMSYRTDGHWLWTESVAYYLRAYRLAPEPGLLAHIRAASGLPAPDPAAEHRALALLFQSAALIPAASPG
ncbi:hypothetical protein [Actinoplanes sp. TFC3]|uniref:hypothetical protein n=1 Tax=Actinoplanes sp. TFC3 TaxID=1710355 RepID=UPI00082E82B7|nr:hypothetical protein [Actinoplanes sp. TFC3]